MSAQIGHVTTAVCVALAPTRDTFDLFGGSMCVGAVCVAVFHMFGLGVWCWFGAHGRAEVISGRVGFETRRWGLSAAVWWPTGGGVFVCACLCECELREVWCCMDVCVCVCVCVSVSKKTVVPVLPHSRAW